MVDLWSCCPQSSREGKDGGCRDGRSGGKVEINQQVTPTVHRLWGVKTCINVADSTQRITNVSVTPDAQISTTLNTTLYMKMFILIIT